MGVWVNLNKYCVWGDKEELSFWPWREGGGTPFLKTPPINQKHIWDTYIRYLPIFPLHFVLLNISADLFAAAITVSINISFSLTSLLSLQLLNSLLLKSTSTYNVFLQNNFVEFFSYFFFFLLSFVIVKKFILKSWIIIPLIILKQMRVTSFE